MKYAAPMLFSYPNRQQLARLGVASSASLIRRPHDTPFETAVSLQPTNWCATYGVVREWPLPSPAKQTRCLQHCGKSLFIAPDAPIQNKTWRLHQALAPNSPHIQIILLGVPCNQARLSHFFVYCDHAGFNCYPQRLRFSGGFVSEAQLLPTSISEIDVQKKMCCSLIRGVGSVGS